MNEYEAITEVVEAQDVSTWGIVADFFEDAGDWRGEMLRVLQRCDPVVQVDPIPADDGDWIESFGCGSGGNTNGDVESLDGASESQVLIEDIQFVVASCEGQNEGDDWLLVARLPNRWVGVQAGCDYTGWRCQAWNRITTARSLGTLLGFGFTQFDLGRMGLISDFDRTRVSESSRRVAKAAFAPIGGWNQDDI